MKLVSAAVDHQQAAAQPKDRIGGCLRDLPGVFGGKRAFKFHILLLACIVPDSKICRPRADGTAASNAAATRAASIGR